MSDQLNSQGAFKVSFETQVPQAIQLSLDNQKPLLMLIKDDSEHSTNWIQEHFSSSLSKFSQDLLTDNFINLVIFKGSTDFQSFLQIFPQFANVSFPTVLIIYRGQIVDLIKGEVTTNEFDEKLKTINENLENYRGRVFAQQQQLHLVQTSAQSNTLPGEISSNTESTTDIAPQTAMTSTTLPQQQSQQPQQPQQQTGRTASTPSPPVQAPSRRFQAPVIAQQPEPNSETKKERRFGSLKEESAELAAKKYRENLARQQRQAQLDKQRVLKLLQQDRAERKLELDSKYKKERSRPVHDNFHNDNLEKSQDCLVQLKLFDGETLRLKFKSDDTLAIVREYILKNFKEYQQLPFYFFRIIDRVTYAGEDEIRTLSELNLNRCTLILKPIDPYEKQEVEKTKGSSSFGWFKNRLTSLLWGENNGRTNSEDISNQEYERQHEQLYYDDPPNTNTHQLPGLNSPILESESDTETVYHSPDIRSLVSRSSSPSIQQQQKHQQQPPLILNSSSSNFNLHGSLLSPASQLLPNAAPNINSVGGQRSASPNLISVGSSNSLSSSSRLRTVDDLDKSDQTRQVYNGNSLNLEDNKKKKDDK